MAVVTVFALAFAVFHQSESSAAATTPVRAAFYYPWYPESWTTPGPHDNPALGLYDQNNATILASHISMAKYAGLDAFISSWWGAGSKTDVRLPNLLNAAAAQDFKIAPYYEQGAVSSDSQIATDFNRLASLDGNPAWLQANGKPVVFIYNAASGNSTCSGIQRYLDAAAGRFYLNFKVFGGYTSCGNQPDSWHQYGPATATDAQGPYSFSVSPGFYKYNESTPRLTRDPARFASNLASMVASGAQWQLVTTFNEWGEDTSVEPSATWQTPSGEGTYLDTMRSVLVGGSQPPPTPTPTPTPTTSSPSPSPTTTSPTPTPTPTTTTPSPTPTPTPTTSSSSSPPPPPGDITKVLTFIGENHSLTQVQSGMPNLWALAQRFAYANNYHAITHPSEPNYLAIAGGSTFGDTGDHNPAFQVAGASTYGTAITAGKTAKAYEESMASNCKQSDNSGGYAVKHNPWASFTDERSQCNLFDVPSGTVGSGALASDVTGGTLPNYGFVVPNLCNDAHDSCGGNALLHMDAWLQAWLDKVMAGPDYTSGHLAIIVTFDENDGSGGNTVMTVVLTPGLDGAHRVVTTNLTHYSLSRYFSQVTGTTPLRNAATAPDFKAAFGL
jgi:acid phosphatase